MSESPHLVDGGSWATVMNFKTRFETALATESRDELLTLASEFESPDKFPAAGNFAGKFERVAVACLVPIRRWSGGTLR